MSSSISVNPDKCTGCGLCVDICASRKAPFFEDNNSCIKILRNELGGMFLPLICRQCEEHPCVDECPVEAIVFSESLGIYVVDESLCVGCGACEDVCPYHGIFVAQTALKCDLCGGMPQCVTVCLPEAITFSKENPAPFSFNEWNRIYGMIQEVGNE